MIGYIQINTAGIIRQYERGAAGVKHFFSIEAAGAVGINAALVLENIAFWVRQNGAAGRNMHQGAAWTYGSVREIAERFPYLSEKQVRGALDRLQEAELIKADNFNKLKYDKTKWYTLTAEGERITAQGDTTDEEGPKESPPGANGKDSKVVPIPDINADIKPSLVTRAAALKAQLGVS